MKKLIFAIFSVSILFFSSCSVYEDLYFLENGQVKYNMTVDASDMMSMVGQSSLKSGDNYPKDSIINFTQIVRDTLKNISPDIEQDLKNIEPLYMRVQNNDSLGILKISLYGDFDNMQAFTNAFNSMSKLESEIKNKENNPLKKMSVDNLFSRNVFSWDGTTLKRDVKAPEKAEGNADEEGEEDADIRLDKTMDESMKRLFSQGKMVVKYHFPKKIKNVSNEDATFSMDGKTAIINYPANLFLEPTNELSIEIETE